MTILHYQKMLNVTTNGAYDYLALTQRYVWCLRILRYLLCTAENLNCSILLNWFTSRYVVPWCDPIQCCCCHLLLSSVDSRCTPWLQFLLLFCLVNNSTKLCNKKSYWHGVFSFWKFYANTSTKVTWHNFDDLVRQCYWVWGDMTSITV